MNLPPHQKELKCQKQTDRQKKKTFIKETLLAEEGLVRKYLASEAVFTNGNHWVKIDSR